MSNAGRAPLFEGYYGMQNTGDDVFCAIAAWGAQRYWGATAAQFTAAALPTLPDAIRPFRATPIFRNGLGTTNPVHKAQHLARRLWAAARASCVVHAGGSTHGFKGRSRSVQLVQSGIALLQRPLAGIGVSVGPFSGERDRQSVARFLHDFAFLALRDRPSYEIARRLDLAVDPIHAFDLAGLLPDVYGAPPPRPQRAPDEPAVLGVSLCHYERYDPARDQATERQREARIVDTLRRLAGRRPLRIRLYVFNNHPRFGDRALAEETAAALHAVCPVEIVPYAPDPGQTWRHMAGCDAFLAVRLHAAIFAYMVHVPFATVAYHHKCDDFAAEVGLSPAYRFGAAGPDPETAVDVLEELLRAPRSPQLPTAEAREKARLNFVCAPWALPDEAVAG